MFGSSFSAPKGDLKRTYDVAVAGISAGADGSHRSSSRAVVAVGAAVAVGVSVLGCGLFYSATQRRGQVDDEEGKGVAPSGTTLSWWQSALTHLPFHRSVEDDDDAFASGTGAANLFDEEKTKARQLSRDNYNRTGRVGGVAAVAIANAATASPRKPANAGRQSEVKEDFVTAIGYPSDIQEREQYIKLVRALLRRQAGIKYSDDDSSSSSDSTDVSLNYHLASTMEATARDDLLMAFAAYEDCNDGAVSWSASPNQTMEKSGNLQLNILVKTLEYLDMSNEREKLRHRRIEMYRKQGRTTPTSSVDAAEVDENEDNDPINAMYRQLAMRYSSQYPYRKYDDEDEEEGGEDMGGAGVGGSRNDFPSAASRQTRPFQAMFGFPMMGRGAPKEENSNMGDSVLDRILGQGSSSSVGKAATAAHAHPVRSGHRTAALGHRDEDMMEEEWEDEDDEDEADFMAYLQQPDDATHFYSRNELRQARRDPENDVRVVGLQDDDSENEDDWEDDGYGEHEEDEEGESDDEEDMVTAEPWSRQDKADFERELFGRIHQLANTYTLTVAMAEREADEEEARKHAERQQRRQQQQQKLQSATVPKTAEAGKNSKSLPPVTEEDEEWEDEGEWEDEDDDGEA